MPSAEHLFNANNNGSKLDKSQARQFHTSTAKLLFVCKRAKPDIQTVVAFLTTHVKDPDEGNWKKLRWVILCLNGTQELPLTLSADYLIVPKWWIDRAFAVHPDMQGYIR
eukprot:7508846-Ditylum_brightwellii.AAC.1